ncbi:uncharacterized protein Z518_10524 [Rhinocladiella mackenziei CBS 650.93]|uniref:Enoyl reductase (ER) domain-containing protein n=1 Tax=Rhinocladiella mackenziei CBS 650.93 TaxID=1442369 RepID=A0A0D2IUI8_9EURO|nr:uncharacterized protein Z518_10524 [Rhinocladiella mackenziei CBS 650.93]KIX00385.1 hypothetical protein Z518_10524 [Rhinocladiella mackenziei CBS 650.93]
MEAAKAWRFTTRGPPRDVLRIESIPCPSLPPAVKTPKEYQHQPWVLIKVSHAALNPGGSYFIAIFPAFSRAKTAIPEIEFSGEVLEIWMPSDSQSAGLHIQKGDLVAGMIPTALTAAGIGALATHLAIPAELVVKLPHGVPVRDAAGITVAGMTALRMARDAGMQPGHRVLVNGASGGVGTMAVQVARDIVGKKGVVVAVCSGRNAKMVRELGADEVIDYTILSNLADELSRRFATQQFDCVLDCVGIPDLYNASAAFLIPGKPYVATIVKPQAMSLPSFALAVGKMVCNMVWPTSRWLGGVGRKWKTVYMMDATRNEREELLKMVAEGKLRVVVDSVWRFEEVLGGYDILWSGRARGKVIVMMDGE